MKNPRALLTRGLTGLLLIAISVALAACGSDSSDDAAASGSTAPKEITIAYQAIPNGDLVVKHNGYLEKAFPDTKINWKLFDSGGSVNEAVTAGSVDIGLAGSSPVSRGISQGIKYQVPWIHDVIGEAEALVVKPDIKSIDDLKGKTIAVPLASTSDFSLRAALKENGVDASDVKIIDAEPDAIYAAWKKGDIDGAYVWNPNLAKIQDDGGKVLITSADLAKKGQTTYDLAVATNEFAEKYPDALNTWAAQQDKAVRLIQDDPDSAAKAIAAELSISQSEALAQLKDLIFLNASEQVGDDYLGGGLGQNLYDEAVFNKELKQIPSVKSLQDYKDAVNAEPAESVK
ncbi:MAG: ABC transporter substrate-binding protein [Solirubrobacterales bacterium]